MGGANSRQSNSSVLTKKELERMQRRFAPCHLSLKTPAIMLQADFVLPFRGCTSKLPIPDHLAI